MPPVVSYSVYLLFSGNIFSYFHFVLLAFQFQLNIKGLRLLSSWEYFDDLDYFFFYLNNLSWSFTASCLSVSMLLFLDLLSSKLLLILRKKYYVMPDYIVVHV